MYAENTTTVCNLAPPSMQTYILPAAYPNIMTSETIFTQRFPAHGYHVKTDLVSSPKDNTPPTTTRNAYTNAGDHIGSHQTAELLCEKMGIAPELATPKSKMCTIGFCEKEQKWYGWKNNRIVGFGIGSTAKHMVKAPTQSDNIEIEELPYRKRPLNHKTPEDTSNMTKKSWTAKTLDDARQMAVDFAKPRS